MNDQPKTAHPNCMAHGCPCLGSMTRSTTGVHEDGAGWLCFAHFGAEGRRWPEITAELNRLGWLVAIARDVRAHRFKNMAAHSKQIKLNQSSHLMPTNPETAVQYIARLEGALQQACAAPPPETKSMFDEVQS